MMIGKRLEIDLTSWMLNQDKQSLVKVAFFQKVRFVFIKKKFFFASSLFKLVTIYVIPRMGRNFDDYPDFQQKARGV